MVAESFATERVIGIETFVKRREYEIVGGVLAHEEFFDDHLAFSIELGKTKRWLAHNVGEQFHPSLKFTDWKA
jgi:hypothetical protein